MLLDLTSYGHEVYQSHHKCSKAALKIESIDSINMNSIDGTSDDPENREIIIYCRQAVYTIKKATEKLYNELFDIINEESETKDIAGINPLEGLNEEAMANMFKDLGLDNMDFGGMKFGETNEFMNEDINSIDLDDANTSADAKLSFFENGIIVSDDAYHSAISKFGELASEIGDYEIDGFNEYLEDTEINYYTITKCAPGVMQFNKLGPVSENVTVGEEFSDIILLSDKKFVKEINK